MKVKTPPQKISLFAGCYQRYEMPIKRVEIVDVEKVRIVDKGFGDKHPSLLRTFHSLNIKDLSSSNISPKSLSFRVSNELNCSEF